MLPETIGHLLHQCSKTCAFRSGLSLHAAVFKAGIHADVIVSNHVLNMYAKCGRINFARHVFDEMSEKNIVSWSAMISGYEQAGNYLSALDLFSKMPLAPNQHIYASSISTCANLQLLGEGRQIHAQSLKYGYSSDSYVSNSLISLYMKCGCCSDALSVFSRALQPNGVSYNALIMGFIQNQQPEKGFEVFKHMHQQCLMPDQFTFVGLLGSCADLDDLNSGMVLHCLTVRLGLDLTAFVGNVIMTMYSKFSLIEEVEKVFKFIKEKDVISWNTYLTACSQCEDHEKSLRAYGEMFEHRMRPDDFTFTSILSACASLASIRQGKQIHGYLIRRMLKQDEGVGNAITNMYAKCGSIAYAYNVFKRMPDRNLISWNTIIAAFANHGLGSRALEIFEQMTEIGLHPNSVTFTGLLMACNHSGMVDRGLILFHSMQETYGIAPGLEHISCLVDLLGRAGRLNEAEHYMRKYCFERDPIVLGSLLSACRLHGDVVMGERLAKQVLKLQPAASTSPYVLLSNLYASDEMWECVAEARKMLKVSGLRKDAGYSMVEVKGNFEKFTVGDFSHARIDEIIHVLKTLDWGRGNFSLDLTP